MRLKVAKDGFVWLILNMNEAIDFYNASNISIYRLYEDGSEGEVLSEEDIMNHRGEFGIEAGFIKDLLPTCPKCGHKLVPSDNPEYVCQCLKCNKDFSSNEI